MTQWTEQSKAKGQLALAMILFGTIGLFVRNIGPPSGVIAMIRGLAGALFMAGLIRSRGRSIAWSAIRRNRLILVLSGIALGFNWILLFEAYRYTTVAAAILSYYFAPVIVILASALFFREKLTPGKIICVVLAVLGMVLVSGLFQSAGLGQADLTGILFGSGAAVLYACVTLLSKQLRDISAYDVTLVQLAVSAVILLPYNLLAVKNLEADLSGISLISLAIVAVVHTGITYALYFSALPGLKSQTIALYSYLDPLVAVLVSVLILREVMTPMMVLGGLLILGSTLLSESLDRRLAKKA